MNVCKRCNKSFKPKSNGQQRCESCHRKVCHQCGNVFVLKDAGDRRWRVARFCSKVCWKLAGVFTRRGLSTSTEHRARISARAKERVAAGKHNFWEGGKTAERQRI